jgi:hypothetical protein
MKITKGIAKTQPLFRYRADMPQTPRHFERHSLMMPPELMVEGTSDFVEADWLKLMPRWPCKASPISIYADCRGFAEATTYPQLLIQNS